MARSASQARLSERIPGLAGCVDEETFPAVSGADRVVDLRDHPLQRDYWWGSPEFEAAVGPLDINQILDRIASDFGIDADFSAPTPLPSSPAPGLDRTVLLVTETDGPAKAWPATKWESLAAQLRPRFDVRQVTRTGAGGDLDPLAVPALAVTNPGAAVDALSSCRGVIGIDTGLTHIAVQQRTPTVTICRHGSRVLPALVPRARLARRPLRCGLPGRGASVRLQRPSQPPGLPVAAPDVPLRAEVPGRAATGAGGTPVRRAGVTVAASAGQPVEVDAHPEVGVRNSQPRGDRPGRRPGRLGGLEQPRTERRLRRPAVATGRRLRHHRLCVRRRALPVRPRRARHPPARRGGGGPGGDAEPPRVGARLRRSGGGVVRPSRAPGPRSGRGRSGSSSR